MRSRLATASRTITGLIGLVMFILAGLAILLVTLFTLFAALGWWAVVVGLLLAPVTDILAVFIIWIATGVFPWFMLVLYGIGLAGMIMMGLSSDK